MNSAVSTSRAPSPLSVLFTLDYELFGDGSGDPVHEQIVPTRHLLDILELYGARLTLFFEYGQYLAYERFGTNHPWYRARNALIVEQLRNAVSRGHDVQLHMHPTWRTAQLVGEKIVLDATSFDISELPDNELLDLLAKGKSFLEDVLSEVDPTYRCVAFRAGAWSASRPAAYLAALTACGFLCDSSVVPGARYSSSYGCFDYRDAPRDRGWWPIGSSLVHPHPTGCLVELPICSRTEPFAFLRYANVQYRRMSRLVARRYPVKVTDRGMGLRDRLKKILDRRYVMADFNALDAKTLVSLVRSAEESRRQPSPVVLIGHSKSSYHLDELHRFFDLSSARGWEFPTVRQTLARIR